LLAYITAAKFVDGLPLYRQERIFNRLNLVLNRSTMARWMVRLGSLIPPLINLMQDDVLASALLHADETEVQVLDEVGKAPSSKSYMWFIGRSGLQPIVLFQYEPHRSKTADLRVSPEFKSSSKLRHHRAKGG
jgi:transposase